MRRVAAAVMLVVGMALIVVGIGSATWWKPSPLVVAATEATSGGIVATEPGVLELVDDTVRVAARAPGTEVEMVVASSDIAAIWLGEERYVAVTGLSDWSTLATEEKGTQVGDEEEEPDEPLSLQGSDLFHPENLTAAPDAVELYFDVPPGDWSLIAIAQDGSTPQLTMTWEREVETPWAIPLIVFGVVLLAAGSALYVFNSQQSAIAERRFASEERATRRKHADTTETSVFPSIAQPEREDVRDETGGAYGAGILPASSRAEELRAADAAADDAAADPGTDSDGTADGDIADSGDDTAAGDDPALENDGGDREPSSEDEFAGENEPAPLAEDQGEAIAAVPADESDDAERAEGLSDEGAAEESLDTGDPEGVDSAQDMGEFSEQPSPAETDETDDNRRASSAEWRSLWGFGPKE